MSLALAGELSFLDDNGDGAGSIYRAWYSGIAAKFHDLATDAVATGR